MPKMKVECKCGAGTRFVEVDNADTARVVGESLEVGSYEGPITSILSPAVFRASAVFGPGEWYSAVAV